MKFTCLTLFPEMFAPMNASITGRAADKGILEFDFVNIRDYSEDKHNRVDDYSFGGGPGMVMQAAPVSRAFEAVNAGNKRLIYMSPRGRLLDEELIRELVAEDEVVILCGHYEGVDQRVLDKWEAEEISIGDYVLTGGELPAMVLMDAVSRFLPGVLSDEDAATEESIYSGLLEYPQYTKPREFQGLEVPEVLLSGDHGKVDLWRFEQALILTKERRPDLFEKYCETSEEMPKNQQKILEKVREL